MTDDETNGSAQPTNDRQDDPTDTDAQDLQLLLEQIAASAGDPLGAAAPFPAPPNRPGLARKGELKRLQGTWVPSPGACGSTRPLAAPTM